tara:strand:- start:1679 stop:1966 length:288 start_codon:yes stop_codon:yes gene_type:complete
MEDIKRVAREYALSKVRTNLRGLVTQKEEKLREAVKGGTVAFNFYSNLADRLSKEKKHTSDRELAAYENQPELYRALRNLIMCKRMANSHEMTLF